ncbi:MULTISPECIES: hypothetical protein [unclassified Microbacterium]|uniref:hypothetical protein n=1 Tax=unclassified Microbacterium TaxID=2609290 RepID=UPI00109C85BE|nr:MULTISPECIES: hypothetical protein [unclassified Microbacterium]
MARTYAYTWSLTDIGLGVLTSWMPEVTVRPAVSAFGPDGLVSDVRVQVSATGGVYSATLIPSGDLTPASGGATGVDYIIEVGRFELADDLTKIWHGTEAWKFTAVAGGGNVGGMNGGSLLAVWIGPPWPAGSPAGLYIDTTPPNAWGIKE